MVVKENISLKSLNTFGLDAKADKLIILNSEQEAVGVAGNGIFRQGNVMIIGGGSNLLFLSDYKGTIVAPEIGGISIEEEKGDFVTVSAGAGEKWDSFVGWCVERGLGGVENLSLIPGNTGAAPVQNIGAYGSEVKDTIIKVRAVSTEDGSVRQFTNPECRFGYRDSIFKGELRKKYLVSRVFFQLSKKPRFRLAYGFLEAETAAIGDISLANIRKAVITVRSRKLPDPSLKGNAGSFFKNPVVPVQKADELKYSYPLMPVYDEPPAGKKIAAGWLIEQCGWKGRNIGNAGVHDRQALVLVNQGGATGKEIFDLSEMIRNSVFEKFRIDLQREVEIIGSI